MLFICSNYAKRYAFWPTLCQIILKFASLCFAPGVHNMECPSTQHARTSACFAEIHNRHSNNVVVPVQVKSDHWRKRQKEECCKLLSSHYFSTIREGERERERASLKKREREREREREGEREWERERERLKERGRERETEKEKRMWGSLGEVRTKGWNFVVAGHRSIPTDHKTPYLELHTLVRVKYWTLAECKQLFY